SYTSTSSGSGFQPQAMLPSHGTPLQRPHCWPDSPHRKPLLQSMLANQAAWASVSSTGGTTPAPLGLFAGAFTGWGLFSLISLFSPAVSLPLVWGATAGAG